MCREMIEAFERADADPAIGAIMVRGNGTAFCAGMDLRRFLRPDQAELVDLHERLFTVIQRARKPIVAAVTRCGACCWHGPGRKRPHSRRSAGSAASA